MVNLMDIQIILVLTSKSNTSAFLTKYLRRRCPIVTLNGMQKRWHIFLAPKHKSHTTTPKK